MSDSSAQTWERRLVGVAQTQSLGRAIGELARPGDLIALIGELGAGKTQLVRGLAVGLGSDPAVVASPTFVMVHEYPPGRDGLVLVHIDAYRLKSAEDLESIGWDQTGGELRRGAVVAVEWADRLGEMLGPDRLEISLAHAGDEERLVALLPRGRWRERMGPLREILDQALPARPADADKIR